MKYSQALTNIAINNEQRLDRATRLQGAATDFTEQEGIEMIQEELERIQLWSVDKIIETFVDPEELLVRAVLAKIGMIGG